MREHAWNKAIRDRAHPGKFVRRHLEACVLTYLAEELRTGDIAVAGAADWAGQFLTPGRGSRAAAGVLRRGRDNGHRRRLPG